jgi:hypothetical protein
MQLNVDLDMRSYPSKYSRRHRRVEMAALSKARDLTEQTAADAAVHVTKTNSDMLNFFFGAQRLLLAEFMFASNEMFERARTETHLFAEFVAKIAGVHSVKGIRELAQECAQHQIDFIRRDSERLFGHGQRSIETASKLLSRRFDS